MIAHDIRYDLKKSRSLRHLIFFSISSYFIQHTASNVKMLYDYPIDAIWVAKLFLYFERNLVFLQRNEESSWAKVQRKNPMSGRLSPM